MLILCVETIMIGKQTIWPKLFDIFRNLIFNEIVIMSTICFPHWNIWISNIWSYIWIQSQTKLDYRRWRTCSSPSKLEKIKQKRRNNQIFCLQRNRLWNAHSWLRVQFLTFQTSRRYITMYLSTSACNVPEKLHLQAKINKRKKKRKRVKTKTWKMAERMWNGLTCSLFYV